MNTPQGSDVRAELDRGRRFEEALAKLLTDGEARAALRAGHAPEELPPAEVQWLRRVGSEELEEAASALRSLVRTRRYRGTGGLADAFPGVVAAWQRTHPEDVDLDDLIALFLSSPALRLWREAPGLEGGACLEEAFARFAHGVGLCAPPGSNGELLAAAVRSLAVAPEPAFRPPDGVRRCPGAWLAVEPGNPPFLHAAVDGCYLCGPITSLVAALLAGATPAAAARSHHVTPAAAQAVHVELVHRRLV